MAEIDKLFKLMLNQGASDLHLSSGAAPYLRIHGEMVPVNHPALDHETVQALVFEICNEKQKKSFVDTWELDFSYTVPGVGRFRANVYMQNRGIGASFRMIPEKIRTVGELNIPKSILDLIRAPRGLILVTGPTGSGKSTTLAALINELNATEGGHIITIEDPIEFIHQNKSCLINQREVSSHTKSFANALRAALREDPDIILVGELRDLETIQLAMTAAETGHLVFGTLHTNSAAKTVDRIIDVFPEHQQAQIRTMLSESLRGVVAQTLFQTADGKGRVAAYEVLMNSSAVGNLIREGKTFQIPSVMQTQSDAGMLTFESSLNALVQAGKIERSVMEGFLGRKKSFSGMQPAAVKPVGPGPANPQNPGAGGFPNPPQGESKFPSFGFKKKTGT